MEKYTIEVEMTYTANLDIEAQSKEEAEGIAVDMIMDGLALKDANLVDYAIVE